MDIFSIFGIICICAGAVVAVVDSRPFAAIVLILIGCGLMLQSNQHRTEGRLHIPVASEQRTA